MEPNRADDPDAAAAARAHMVSWIDEQLSLIDAGNLSAVRAGVVGRLWSEHSDWRTLLPRREAQELRKWLDLAWDALNESGRETEAASSLRIARQQLVGPRPEGGAGD